MSASTRRSAGGSAAAGPMTTASSTRSARRSPTLSPTGWPAGCSRAIWSGFPFAAGGCKPSSSRFDDVRPGFRDPRDHLAGLGAAAPDSRSACPGLLDQRHLSGASDRIAAADVARRPQPARPHRARPHPGACPARSDADAGRSARPHRAIRRRVGRGERGAARRHPEGRSGTVDRQRDW